MGSILHRRPVVMLAAIAVLATVPAPAAAHDFGSLSINVYSRLTVEQRQVRVRWVLDMAEIPAGAIVDLIDQDGDGSASEPEQEAYFATWLSSVLEQIHLSVDGAELAETVVSSALTLPIGENGARYLRVNLDLAIDLPAAQQAGEHLATYRDENYEEYIGWREVVVAPGVAVELLESSVAAVDRTNELQTYPPDLGASTPNSQAEFRFRIMDTAASPGASVADGPAAAASDDLLAVGLLLLAVLAVVGSAVVGVSGSRRRARRQGS